MTFKSILKAEAGGLGHYEEPDLPPQAGLETGPGSGLLVKMWTVHGCPDI